MKYHDQKNTKNLWITDGRDKPNKDPLGSYFRYNPPAEFTYSGEGNNNNNSSKNNDNSTYNNKKS